jgi:hypothetical protein
MISKAQALKIARTVAGFCVAAGLIYFLYNKNSPPAVSTLIILAVVFFFILRRRSGALDKNPYLPEIQRLGSRTPVRDLVKALICFVAMMVVTIGGAIGVKNKVIPDNYLTAGVVVVVIVGGGLAVGFFVLRALIRLMFGGRRETSHK